VAGAVRFELTTRGFGGINLIKSDFLPIQANGDIAWFEPILLLVF